MNKHGVSWKDTIMFIQKDEIPVDRKVRDTSFLQGYCLLKSEPYHISITVCSDQLLYLVDFGSSTTNLLETKLPINSTISNSEKGAQFIAMDIKAFSSAASMERTE